MVDVDQDAFYEGRRSERMPFVVNDAVVVREGSLAGATCAVISPVSVEGKLAFVVEAGDGRGDSTVSAESLELLPTDDS